MIKKVLIVSLILLSQFFSFSQLQESKNRYFDEYNGAWIWDTAGMLAFYPSSETQISAYVIDDGTTDAVRLRILYDNFTGTGQYGGQFYPIINGNLAARTVGQFGDPVGSGFTPTNYNGITVSNYDQDVFGETQRFKQYTITPDQINVTGFNSSPITFFKIVEYEVLNCNTGWQHTDYTTSAMTCSGTVTSESWVIGIRIVDPDKGPRTFSDRCESDADPVIFNRSGLSANPGQFGDWSDMSDYITNITTDVAGADYENGTNMRIDISAHGEGDVNVETTWTAPSLIYLNRDTDYTTTTSNYVGHVFGLPEITVDETLFLCSNSGNNLLPSATPTGGTWSGTYVTDNVFDTDAASDGDHIATYTYVDTNGCSSSADVTVSVGLPTVSITTPPRTICIGDRVTIEAAGAETYSWSPNTGLISTAGQSVIAEPDVTTTYTVTGTSDLGCSNTASITITVNPAPGTMVTSDADDDEVCKGGEVRLSVEDAGPGSSYSWRPSSRFVNPSLREPLATVNGNTEFTVDITNANGCKSEGSIFIYVTDLPVANAGSDNEVCTGVDYELDGNGSTGTGTLSYSWSGTGIVSGENTATPTINTSVDRVYTLTVTDSNGCTNTDEVEIEVDNTVANAGTDKVICEGESVQVSASGGVSFSWAPSTGLSDTQVSSPVASPSITTDYTVSVTNSNGCVDTDVVRVTVNTNPVLTVSGDAEICKGTSVDLTVTGGNTYLWTPSSGLNGNNLATVTASPSVTTLYTVTGTNASGCESSQQVLVTVLDNPNADAGDDKTVCSGEQITLQGSGTGNGSLSYSWSGPNIVGGGSTTDVVVEPAANSTYTLTVTDVNGCIDTDQVKVDITVGNANAGSDRIMCLGESISLSASGGVSYLWSNDGGGSTDLNDNEISNPVFTPSSVGTYELRVNTVDNLGCSASDVVSIDVQGVPAMTVTSDQTICKGDGVILTSTGASSYDWNPSSGLNITNLSTVTASPNTTTVYTVTGANNAGCETSLQVIVYVNELPDADAGSDTETCIGESVQLNGSGSLGSAPYTYLWAGPGTIDNNTSKNPNVTVSATSTFVLTVTDANGCTDTDEVRVTTNQASANAGTNKTICFGESIQLSASGGQNYSWNNSGSLNDDGVQSPIASPTTTTTYTVTVIDGNGCVDTDDVIVNVVGAPILTVSSDQTICKGSSVNLSASGASTYQWDPSTGLNVDNIGNVVASPNSTTVYTVTGTNAQGCETSQQVIVNVNELPIADAGDDKLLCRGEQLIINGSASGVAPFTYSWSGNNIVSGGNSASVTVNPTIDRVYTLTATDANGCVDVDVVEVEIRETLANAGANKTICEGESVQLSASGGVAYSWVPATGLSDDDVSSPVATPSVTTTYTVTVTGSDGCIDTDDVTVTVNSIPVLTVPGTQTLCEGESVQLNVSGAASYSWSPSTGLSSSSSSNPFASPSVTTIYTVTGISASGCETEEQIIVNVNELPDADAGSDLLVCSGEDLVISGSATGTAPFIYLWSGANIVSGGSTSDVTVNPTATGNYILTVVDGNGCESTDQVKVTVTNANANAGLNKTICIGETVSLNGTGGISYSWSRVGGGATNLDDNNSSSPVFTGSVAGTYNLELEVTDNNGCTDTDLVVVQVNNVPNLVVDSDQTLCKGESVSITASGASSYSWSPSTGLNVSNLSTVIASPNVTTIYTVAGSNGSGCETSEQIIVYVNELPIADAGDDVETCSGESVVLSGSTSQGTAPYSYLWTGTGIVSNANTATPTINTTVDREYTLTVTDANGCTDSDQVRVEVNAAIANAGSNISICSGESVQLSASGGVSYSWNNSGTLNDDGISNPTATPSSTTTYTVTIVDNNGCTDTDDVTVTVQSIPTLSVTADQTICRGSSTTLTATGANNYSWSPSTGLNVSNIGSVIASPSVTTIYTVTGTNGSGCTSSEQVIVYVNDLPVADAGSDKQVCSGEDLVVSGSATGNGPFTYSWSGNGIAGSSNSQSITVNISSVELYTMTVTDANGCTDTDIVEVDVYNLPNSYTSVDDLVTSNTDICVGTTVQLEAYGGSTYLWSGDAGISNVNIANPTITVNNTKTLSVVVTNSNGCEKIETLTLNAVNNPVVDAGSVLNICIDDEPYDLRNDVNIQGGVFTGNGIVNDFLFDPSEEGTTGIFIVTYDVNVGGCSGSDTREIRVKSKPTISISAPLEICPGESEQLVASGALTYSWTPDLKISNTSIANPIVSPTTTTTYTVTGIDQFGCSSSKSVTITVNDLEANAGSNKVMCEGESVTLDGSSSKSNVTYSWSPSTGLNDDSIEDPVASPSVTTLYTLSVTDINGCTVTDDVLVTVETKPTLNIGTRLEVCHSSISPIDLRNDVNIPNGVFTSTSSALDGVLFQGSEDEPGIYFVEYTVLVGNCELSAVREIEILDDPEVTINQTNFEVCEGESAQIIVSGGASYSYFPEIGISDPTISNPTISPDVTTNYRVRVTDLNGCYSDIEFSVEVLSVSAFAGNDVTICEGESIELNGSGGNFYSWSNPSSLSNSNISNPIASPNTTTTYTVTVTDSDGCSGTDEVTVFVNDAPDLDAGDKLVLCSNDDGGYDLRADINITGATFESESSGLVGVQFYPSNTDIGIHFVDVTVVSNGCSVTETREIEVVAPSQVSVSQNEILVCEGESVQLSASNVSDYTWSPNIDIDNNNIFNPTIIANESRTYTVIGVDGNGCETVASVNITIVDDEVIAGDDVTICEGESVELGASGVSLYSWNYGSTLSSTNSSSPIATPQVTTTYTVTGTNSQGCVSYDDITVTVLEKADLDLGGSVSICIDDDAFDVRSYANIQGGIWSSSSSALEGVIFTPSNDDAGIVFLEYSVVSGGCLVTAEKEIQILGLPNVTVSNDVEICTGSSVQISASGGSTYEWFPKSDIDNAFIFNPTVNPTVTTEYTVSVTNINGCSITESVLVEVNEPNTAIIDNVTICEGETVQLFATGGRSYVWNNANTLDDSRSDEPFATPSVTTTYTVSIVDSNGCTSTESVTVTVEDAPDVEVGGVLKLCKNGGEVYDLRNDVTYPGGTFSSESSGLVGVLFDPSEVSNSGIYFVDYTVNVGTCSVTKRREIQVIDDPIITAEREIYTICKGESVQLNVAGGAIFTWFPNISIDDVNIQNPTVNPSVSRVYTVTSENVNGCVSSKEISVVVKDISANAGEDKTICLGESVELVSDIASSYYWDGDNIIGDTELKTVVVSPIETTTYTLEVISEDGCIDTDEVTVFVNSFPVLDVGEKLTLCVNDDTSYDLRNEVNLSNAQFSGNTSGLSGVSFNASNAGVGIYFIDVRATSNGCSVTESKEIEVVNPTNVEVLQSEVFVCEGESIEIGAENSQLYEWYPSTNLSNTSIPNPVVVATESRLYTVYGTDINGCETSATVQVTVVDNRVEVSEDVTICEGESVELSASGVSIYSWNNEESLSNASVANPIATPLSTTTYRVTGLNSQGCESVDEITVTVLDVPELDLGGRLLVCEDDDAFDIRDYSNIKGGTWSSSSSALEGVIFTPLNEDPGIIFLEYSVVSGGCLVSGEKEIQILSKPSISIIDDQEICIGSSVQLSASGGVSYEWFPKSEISNAYVFNPIVSPETTTEYTVIINDINGCSNTDKVLVEVNEPTVSIISDLTICEGESVKLFASGGRNYLWSNGSSLDDIRSDEPIATPISTTTYSVEIIDRNGCVSNRSVTVNVDDAPIVEVGDVLHLCQNGGEIYDLRQDVSYQGGVFSSESNGLVGVQFDPSAVSSAGIYFVDYTVVVGTCTVTKTREIHVESDPVVSYERDLYEICKGDKVQLSVSGGISYSWFPTTNMEGSTTSDPEVRPNVSTTYVVSVENEYGCVSQKAIDVVVNDAVADAGQDITICRGESIQLDGSGGIVYEWTGDSSISDDEIFNPFVSPETTTEYTLNVINENGCTDSDIVKVTVIQPLDLEVGNKLTLCYDDNSGYDLRNDVSVSGGIFSSTSNGLSGVRFNASETNGPGVYFVDYTISVSGCEQVMTREIEVVGGPIITYPRDVYEICKGETLQLSVDGGISYSWFPTTNMEGSTTSSPLVSPSVNTSYTVSVASPLGCVSEKTIDVIVNNATARAGGDIVICRGESIELSGSGGSFYKWLGDETISDSEIANPIVSPESTTTYTLTVETDEGCTDADVVKVTVIQPLDLKVGEKLRLCYDDLNGYDLRDDVSVSGGIFSSNSSGLSGVKFNPSDDEPGVYFVDYTITVSGCEQTETREIEILDGPILLTGNDDYTVCSGDNILLDIVSSTYDSVQWSPEIGLDNPRILNPLASPLVNTTYKVEVFNEGGCSRTMEVPVIVENYSIEDLDNIRICKADENIDLSSIVNGVWSGSYVIDNRFYPDEVGEYWLMIQETNRNGCVGLDSIRVNVLDVPSIELPESKRVTLCLNDDVTDLNEFTNQTGIEWDGDNTTSSGLFDPSKSGPGTFVVALRLENSNGCGYDDYITVKVNRLPDVYAGPDIQVCLSSDTIDMGKLAIPKGGDFFGSGVLDNQYFIPSDAGQGRHFIDYNYVDPLTGCVNTSSREINVLDPVPVFAGAPLSLCIDSGPVDLSLSVSPAGGVFYSDLGVNGTQFYPSTGIGIYTIEYTVTDENNCTNTSVREITVNERPELIITPRELVACYNQGLLKLDDYVNIKGGLWSGASGIVNGLLNTEGLELGTTVLTYEVETFDGCNLIGDLVLKIENVEELDLGDDISTCNDGDDIDLLDGFNKEFVSVTGDGVDENGVFIPSLVSSGTYVMNYEYVNKNGCIASQVKRVFVQKDVFVDAGNDFTVCKNIGEIDLLPIGIPEGGVWSGNPDFLSLNKFDASKAPLGDHELYYTIDLGLGCISTDTLNIEVTSSSITDFGSDTLVCINTGEILLNFSNELSNGKWIGTGVVNNIFYPSQSGPGTFTLSYENSNFSCEIAGQRSITVIDLPERATTADYNISGCVSDVVRIIAEVPNPNNNSQVNFEWYYEGEIEPFAVGKSIDFQIRGTENIYFNSVNQFGCRRLENDFISISANGPIGEFSASKDTLVIGELIQFVVNTSNVDSYYWEFGDGNFSTDKNANYKYWVKGTYDVSLTMTSPDECTNTIFKPRYVYVYDPADTVTVVPLGVGSIPDYSVYPNPFSDIINVEFDLEQTGKVTIYDMSGRQVLSVDFNREREINMDINEWPSGAYLMDLELNGVIERNKIIKLK